MLTIGLDARILTLRIGGVGRYALSLAESLAARRDLRLALLAGPGAELDGHFAAARVWNGARGIKSALLRAAIFLPTGAAALGVDLFHAANYGSAPLWRPGAFPLVVTLHDISPLMFPEHFTFKHRLVAQVLLHQLAKGPARFIAVSEVSRRDAVERLGIEPERIAVVPEAPPRWLRRIADPAALRAACSAHGLDGPYLIAVGTLEPRKNLPRLLRAFRALVQSGRDHGHKLALVGQRGWLSSEIPRLLADPVLTRRVVTTGFVPDQDLGPLYSGATAALYPSLYEGFGLPVLEAMATGTPLVASRAGSIPEVAGGAALLVDPKDEEELANAMARVLDDAALRAELSARGLAQSARFSWDQATEKTVAVYRTALAER